jgi:hypothetical protein
LGTQSKNNNAPEQPSVASAVPTLNPPQAVTSCIGNCTNGQGRINYPNGDKYVGAIKSNKADGQGTFTYQDGSKYVGEFKNGEIVQNNSQATPQTDNSKLAPDAVTLPSNPPDETQPHCIKGNCINGRGTQTYPDGSKYIGQFKNGLSEGQGTLILSNGDKYVGKFKQDKFQQ